jgi:hypothetical protein
MDTGYNSVTLPASCRRSDPDRIERFKPEMLSASAGRKSSPDGHVARAGQGHQRLKRKPMKGLLNSHLSEAQLRGRIVRSLRAQGFRVRNGTVLPPEDLSKQKFRELHETAVKHRTELARGSLSRKENQLLQHIASGAEVVPSTIRPHLLEVFPGSQEEPLFRYASLHWRTDGGQTPNGPSILFLSRRLYTR